MRYMTEQQRDILGRLVQIAGSSLLVEQALRDLNRGTEPPTLEDLLE